MHIVAVMSSDPSLSSFTASRRAVSSDDIMASEYQWSDGSSDKTVTIYRVLGRGDLGGTDATLGKVQHTVQSEVLL